MINNENAGLILNMHSMGGMLPEEIAEVLSISVDEVNAVINNTNGIDNENWDNEYDDEDEGEVDYEMIDHMMEAGMEPDEIAEVTGLSKEEISSLSSEEADSLFGDLIGLYMDVSGTDNLGDVYELLTAEIGVDEKHAEKLLS